MVRGARPSGPDSLVSLVLIITALNLTVWMGEGGPVQSSTSDDLSAVIIFKRTRGV